MKHPLSLALGALGALATVAATATFSAGSNPVLEAEQFFGVTGLDRDHYFLGGGGYGSGALGWRRHAHAEFVAKGDNTDRVTIRIERQLPFAPWRLAAIDRSSPSRR